MDEQQKFLLAIAEHPEDESLRLVFAAWLEEHGFWDEMENSRPPGCEHEFRTLHRIRDVRLRDEPFRLICCLGCNEVLHLYRIDEGAWGEAPGVSIELRGEELRAWVEGEDGESD